MRLVTFLDDSVAKPGGMRDDGIVDLSAVRPSVIEIIRGGAQPLEEAEKLLATADATCTVENATLSAPIHRPERHLYCVGWNYLDHFEEGAANRGRTIDLPEYPAFFTKPPHTVIGPSAAISYDGELTTMLDYEGEVAVVIGRGGRSIPVDRAGEHIFGYMLANDVTARDIQRRHGGQWLKGKAMDTFCPTGPWIATADEIPDLLSRRLQVTVNGELRQDALLGQMIFTVERLVSELSRGMTLVAGDVVLTGTPSGVGSSREPPEFLGPGDVVEVSLPGLGRLTNPVMQRHIG